MNPILSGLALLAVSLLPMATYAVDNPTNAFVSAPDGVLPTISSDLRLDMLDYYHSGYNRSVENDFGEPVKIDTITSDRIVVRVADNSQVEMSLLPLSAKDTAVVVISTLEVPAATSFVKVYHGDWVEYSDVLPFHALTDWVMPQGKPKMADIENKVPFITAKLTFDPATRLLTAVNTLHQYFTPEDYAELKPYLRPALTYKWNGKKFRLLKP